MEMKTLVLFDIDGTILSARGEGRASYYETLEELFPGVSFPHLDLAGRTDFGVWRELVGAHPGTSFSAFAAPYARRLEARLGVRPPVPVPGAYELFRAVAAHPEAVPCLVTGNIREGARLKMAAAGLWDAFERRGGWGVWGDRHLTKTGLTEALLRSWWEQNGGRARAVFLGDTAADLACAASSGVPCAAVGRHAGTLTASGAVAGWHDFTDPEAGLEAVLGLAEEISPPA